MGPPSYCALVFSLEPGGRIWLARDKHHLYVDRRGEGNLTGATRRVELPPDRLGVPIDAGDLYPQGVDRPVRLKLHQFLIGQELTIYLHLWFADGRREGSSPIWSPAPGSAPRAAFHGPLTLAPCSFSPVLSRGGTGKLEVQLGRAGIGERSFAWRNHSDVPHDVHPLAEVRFASTETGARVETYPLDERCCGCRFFRRVEPPEGISQAEVVVSFDDWPAGAVEPGRFKIAFA
ncbi:MAG TPA: hypothetical protein VG826_12095 [Pirellulales bacterium]|nr:hypothetical protein [Pirellulales bacterium]